MDRHREFLALAADTGAAHGCGGEGVEADRHPHMGGGGGNAVRGIEGDPAELRQIRLGPGMASLLRGDAYRGKNLLFISGVNIDVSPRPGMPFPLTKFVPWAAYIRLREHDGYTLEQAELFDLLSRQSRDNPDQMSFDAAIHAMAMAEEVRLPLVD